MLRRFVVFLICLAALVFGLPRYFYAQVSPWQTIAPGVELREFHSSLASGRVHIIALRTSPSRVHLESGAVLTAPQWRVRSRALAAVNGGFFDESQKALGLRIARGKRLSPLRNVDQGVFYVRRGAAHIARAKAFKLQKGITEAVQCGPRLVAAGHLVKLKDQWARRTALGIQRDGKVIVAVTDSEIGFRDWAALWAIPTGLNCPNAMGLDGGASTQLSLKTRSQSIEIEGFTDVPDSVVIR